MSAAPLLRPLGVGDIVDRVVTLYRENFKLFILVAALPSLVVFVVEGAIAIAFPNQPNLADTISIFQALGDARRLAELNSRLAGAAGPPPLVNFVVIVVTVVTTVVQSVAVMHVVAARYLGRDVTVDTALRVGFAGTVRVFFVWLIGFIFLAILVGILTFALLIEVGILGLIGGGGGALGVIIGVVVIVEFFVVYFVAFGLCIAILLLETPVAIFERAGPLKAFRRTWSLIGGNRRRMIGLMLLLYVLYLVLSLGVAGTLVASVAADRTIVGVATVLVSVAAGMFWAPIFWGTVVVAYYDLRVRKEAFDLQLASEMLPRDA